MRHSIILLVAVLCGDVAGAFTAMAASPVMRGNWDITFCDDLNKTTCDTVCWSFTRVPGTVAGSSTSGTVAQPGALFPLDGKFLQLGDRVTAWASLTAGPLSSIAFFEGSFFSPTELNGESFVQFAFPDGQIRVGSWHAVKTATCP
jgi:hypothetical protein